ncbi:MAG TPA: hypothetical protein VFE62_18860 [Gemmataceae bacterium]|nr:hypothetical protein [Gemmataceae bacterium]
MDSKEKCDGDNILTQPVPSGGVHDRHDHGSHEEHVTIRLLPAGHEAKFQMPANASLLEVLEMGARQLRVTLLPAVPLRPLDQLHDIASHDRVGPPIHDLDQALGPYLKMKGTTPHFGIELVLAFHVNTRWAVASSPDMTPRAILALPAINLPYAEYTLYLPGSNDPLPIDKPIHLKRGEALEAQRDGKYGKGA